MIRLLNLVLVVTSVMALIGVYALKYSVEETASEKRRLEVTISEQEGDLSLLEADWAYLNQPVHVAPIVTRHAEQLALVAVQQKQFGLIDALPMRPKKPNKQAMDALFQALETGADPIGDLILETE